MSRRFIALLLIISVLFASFCNVLVYAGFELNKEYIVASLCENKDKPMLNCAGKCYLAKKIKQAEEKERGQERQSQKNRFQEALITQKIKLEYPSVISLRHASFEKSFDLPQHSSSIFHPPRA
jgi:hypothetical protein